MSEQQQLLTQLGYADPKQLKEYALGYTAREIREILHDAPVPPGPPEKSIPLFEKYLRQLKVRRRSKFGRYLLAKWILFHHQTSTHEPL